MNFYGQTLENVRSYIDGAPQRVMNSGGPGKPALV